MATKSRRDYNAGFQAEIAERLKESEYTPNESARAWDQLNQSSVTSLRSRQDDLTRGMTNRIANDRFTSLLDRATKNYEITNSALHRPGEKRRSAKDYAAHISAALNEPEESETEVKTAPSTPKRGAANRPGNLTSKQINERRAGIPQTTEIEGETAETKHEEKKDSLSQVQRDAQEFLDTLDSMDIDDDLRDELRAALSGLVSDIDTGRNELKAIATNLLDANGTPEYADRYNTRVRDAIAEKTPDISLESSIAQLDKEIAEKNRAIKAAEAKTSAALTSGGDSVSENFSLSHIQALRNENQLKEEKKELEERRERLNTQRLLQIGESAWQPQWEALDFNDRADLLIDRNKKFLEAKKNGDVQAMKALQDELDWYATFGGDDAAVLLRQITYENNLAEIERLDAAIASLVDARSKKMAEGRVVAGEYTGPDVSLLDTRIRDLEYLKGQLEQANRQYEITDAVNDANYALRFNADFGEVSSWRNFINPDEEELYAYGQAKSLSDKEVGDILTAGGSYDEDGNLVDVTGNIVSHEEPTAPIVTDKLGLFLNARDKDGNMRLNPNKLEEAQEIVLNGLEQNIWADFMVESDAKSWSELKEDEIATYYYLYHTEGKASAYAYLDSLTPLLNKRETDREMNRIYEAKGWARLGYNLASIPQNILGGVTAFAEDVINSASGRDINPYSRLHLAQTLAQATRSTTGEIIDNFAAGNPLTRDELTQLWKGEYAGEIPDDLRNTILGISLGDAYQAGMSGLDSLFGGVLLGPAAYGSLMGMGAASTTAKNYYEKGASRDEIISISLVAGAAEMLFEKWSVEKLLSRKAGDGFLKNFLQQGLAEGSEEVNTELANIITDALAMGTQSDWEAAIRAYEAEGNTRAEASALALTDIAGRLWKAGAAGFISGGMSSGFYTVAQQLQNGREDQALRLGLACSMCNPTPALTTAGEIATAINRQRASIAARQANGETIDPGEYASLESKKADLKAALKNLNKNEKAQAEEIVRANNKGLSIQQKRDVWLGRAVERGVTATLTAEADTDAAIAAAEEAVAAVEAEQTAPAAPTIEEVIGEPAAPAHTPAVASVLEAAAKGDTAVTGNFLDKIIADPAAMAELEIDPNLTASGRSKAEQRKAVKAAVMNLYQKETAAVEEAREKANAKSAEVMTPEETEAAEQKAQTRAELIERMRTHKGFANMSEEDLNEYLDYQDALGNTEGRTVRVQTGEGSQWVSFNQFYRSAKARNKSLSTTKIEQLFEDLYATQEGLRETLGGSEVERAIQSRSGQFVYSTADKDFIDYSTFRLLLMEHGSADGTPFTEAQIAATFDAQYAADQKTPGRSDAARERQLENSVKALNRNKVLKDSKIEVSVVFNSENFAKVSGQTVKASFTNIVDANGKTIGKKIVFNGDAISSRDALIRTLVHEIVHPAKKSAGAQGEAMLKAIVQTAERLVDKGQLSRRVAQKVKFREQELKNLSKMYTEQEKRDKGDKARPQDWTWDSANVFEEYAADLLRDILYETKTAKAIFSAKPSAAHTLLGHAIGIRSKMGKISAEEQELAAELDNIIKIVRDALDGKVADLEKQLDETAEAEETTGEVKHSIESIFDAGGMTALQDTDSGQISFFLKEDMSPVDTVTADHIKYKSGIGLLIDTAVQNKFITDAEATEQYKAAAELFNTIIKTQDPDMVWEFAGASLFSAVKTNADGQYGTTIDFTTVCRKTQDMITAMSKAMVDLKRGLTKDEVTQLQKKLLANDAQVPCPVCYVFSRWAGVGAVLDKMYYWQNKYENATAEELQARIKQLEGLTKKADLRRQLREDDSVYQDLAAEQEKLKQEKAKLNRALTAAKKRKKQDAETQRIQKENPAQIAALDAKLAAIKKQIKDIEDRGSAELAWLLKVRTADNYAAVPAEVLFDLDAGKAFAAQYPVSWAYRTSRGPGVGKAILPYSDMRLGDGIIGPKAADETKDGTQKRDLFKDAAGKWTTDQQKAIDRAIIRTAAQNLIGGQRFQSTSDFRYEYALDYLMAFWEMQALGSNMQTYTKVIEFVDMVAAIGGDVNMSVMPKNAGYADGKLIFSNVTGMNIEAARRANALYDNAQMILVGINDQHIRLALEDSAETGGNEIGFVIPYHASGASIENFISQLVANLNEQFVKDNYTDYSDVQTDHSRKGATEEQARRGDIRKAILTGRVGNEAWTPSAEDFLLMQGESVDISNRSFDELRDIEKRALAGEQAAIDEYLSWSAGILQDLYNRFNGSEVHLKSTQAASIMPHEYWNKSTTRANAYVNGFIFRSYCYSLGLSPRFTGIASNGKTVDHGDFSDSTGYWKTLIDRPMYRNDGTYRDQQRINVTKFDAGMLTPAWAEERWGDYKLAEPSKTKATKAADEFVAETRYSIEDEKNSAPVGTQKSNTASTSPVRKPYPSHAERGAIHRTHNNATAGRDKVFDDETISQLSANVKPVVIALRKLVHAIDEQQPPPGSRELLNGENLKGNLMALGVVERENVDSGYRYWATHALRISSHFSRPRNFRGHKSEYLSLVLAKRAPFRRGAEPTENNAIEVFFNTQSLTEAKIRELLYDLATFVEYGEYHDFVGADEYHYTGSKKFIAEAKKRMAEDRKAREKAAEQNTETKFSIESDSEQSTPTLDELFGSAQEAYAEVVEQAAQNPVTAEAIGSPAQADAPIGMVIYGSSEFDQATADELNRVYEELVKQYGPMKPKRTAVRNEPAPRRTAPGNKVMQTTTTVLGAQATPESRIADIKRMVVDQKVSYVPNTNVASIQKARGRISRMGFQEARVDWSKRVNAGETSGDLVTLGAVLLNNAGNSAASGEEYVSILTDYAQLLHNAGEALQAAKVLQKLTPEGKLYTVQKTVDKINEGEKRRRAKRKGGHKNRDSVIDAEHNPGLPVDQWMDKVGEQLAQSIIQKLSVPETKARTVSQTILADLKKFSEDTIPTISKKMAKRSSMDRLRDLFENRENYEKAWAAAKKTMREQFGAKSETMAAINEWMEQSLDFAALLTREVTDIEGVKIKGEYAEAYLLAKTDEQRDAMLQLIYKDIASQIKATGLEKFTALRYLGMLGNLRTQVRNVLGNAMFQPVRMVSESIQGILEAGLQRVGVNIDRTTSVLLDGETLKVARTEYLKVRDAILAGGKYQETSGIGDNARDAIEKYRTIFSARIKGKNVHPLEAARKATNWAMDTGDSIFCSFTFADALARYIKANRTTWSKASDTLKDKAIAYAIREAAEATYRDTNQFSKMISSLGRAKNDSKAERIKAAIFTGVMPFRKTPANILVRAVEYSPIGLLDSAIRKSIQAARGAGEVTGTDIVRGLSKGLTGTGLTALGFALAAAGCLRGKLPEDEDEKWYMEMLGYQAYSFERNGQSYTLDWLAPECIPLFLGANLHDAALSSGMTVDEVWQAFTSLTDPLLSMSMLQGVNDALESTASYGTDQALFRFVANSLWSYMTQPIGTLLGQVKRASNNTRMTTYVDKNKAMPDYLQRTLGKLAAKVPFWNYAQVAYTDAWGRMEQNAQSATWNVIQQIISPGYASTIEVTPMEEELLRLANATGDSSVLIQTPAKYFNVNGERKDLTADEYTSYNMIRGQTAFNLMTALVKSAAYQKMDDAAKAKAVSNIYTFATQSAKLDITNNAYEADKWVLNSIDAAYNVGLPVESVVLYKTLLSNLNAEYPDGIVVAGTLMDVNAYVREQMYADMSIGNTQKEALDNILISDGQYIPKDLEVDYSNGWDAFKMSQQSGSAQTKFTNLPSHFDLDAEEFTAAYKICQNDELSSTEKKVELEAIAGSEDAAYDLYDYISSATVKEESLSNLPENISTEILRLSTSDVGYQYSIGYYDNTPTSYKDPDSKVNGKGAATKEWRLTVEQQDKYKEMREDLYTRKMNSLLGSGSYKSASDAKKCEMIVELKSEVTEEVKEDFIDWLSRNAKSTPVK